LNDEPRIVGGDQVERGAAVRVVVDFEKCVGAGNCVAAAPAVFDQQDDDGLVLVLDENPPAPEHEATRRAARLCPANAITIEE
jgi:ferredoxin